MAALDPRTPLDASTREGTVVAAAVRDPRVSFLRLLLGNPVGLVTMVILSGVALTAVFAPVIVAADPNFASIKDVLGGPAPGHPLGFDSAGRDVLSRLLYAGRFSLAGALLALLVGAGIGVTTGLAAAYFGGWFDTVSVWVADLVIALPGVVLLLAARSVIGSSMWMAMAIFGVLVSPSFFRLVYASVRAVRGELYVDAARVAGLSDTRIIRRHILTVVRAPVIIQSAMVMGIAIAVQAGLEFLGLGDLTVPTWGNLLQDGFANIYSAPLLVVWPGLMITLVSVCLTLLANTMRDLLERSGQTTKRSRKTTATRVDPDHVEVLTHPDDARSSARLGEVLLEIRDLSVGYRHDGGLPDKVVVHDVSLAVRRGEVHGLIGESGSGKTQTAWSVLGLLPAGGRLLGGSIVFDGTDLAQTSEKEMTRVRGRRIAYVPQEPMSNLDPAFTIGHQLVEPMMVCLKISKKDATAKALELLARVGIPNPRRTFSAYPHEVSGGMAQRVLIAGAVSCQPDLLIADEPTTALDVTVQAEVLDLIRSLQADMNMGVLIVTHNFGVVADLCDRVSVMRDGRVVETGPVRAIFYSAKHEYTRSLLADTLQEQRAGAPLVKQIVGPPQTDDRGEA